MTVFTLMAFIFEIFALVFIVWGAFHEARLIAFERKAAQVIRKAVRK